VFRVGRFSKSNRPGFFFLPFASPQVQSAAITPRESIDDGLTSRRSTSPFRTARPSDHPSSSASTATATTTIPRTSSPMFILKSGQTSPTRSAYDALPLSGMEINSMGLGVAGAGSTNTSTEKDLTNKKLARNQQVSRGGRWFVMGLGVVCCPPPKPGPERKRPKR
jgi:hypothetical protein